MDTLLKLHTVIGKQKPAELRAKIVEVRQFFRTTGVFSYKDTHLLLHSKSPLGSDFLEGWTSLLIIPLL